MHILTSRSLLFGFVEVTTCAVPAAPREPNSIEVKLILTQVTLASDDDDGIHANNKLKKLSEEDILNNTSTVNQ